MEVCYGYNQEEAMLELQGVWDAKAILCAGLSGEHIEFTFHRKREIECCTHNLQRQLCLPWRKGLSTGNPSAKDRILGVKGEPVAIGKLRGSLNGV